MLEWILGNFWSFWLIMMLLLVSVQVLTGEMTFLLIPAGALSAIVADVLGAPIYVRFIIVTVISIASLIWLRRFDTKRPENDGGPSRRTVHRYDGKGGGVPDEVTSSQGSVRTVN